ncbi:hypothetical protein EB796_022209 [Bugula neritina]|uniref:Uncharacterized protein n=1 Tax=Bugula neritina TaxID=10212 RepID=A0A7J7J0W2_BUGNE|nr:hypothetical protein EB796_022209 [Bugula neritina]
MEDITILMRIKGSINSNHYIFEFELWEANAVTLSKHQFEQSTGVISNTVETSYILGAHFISQARVYVGRFHTFLL